MCSSRFFPAFGISLAFLIGLLVVQLADFFRISPKLKRFKVSPFIRKLASFGLIGLIFILIPIIIIFSSRSFWELGQARVLGLTAEQKVGIWEIKEKTSQLESLIGYTITGLTVFSVAVLKTRLGI